MIMPKFHILEKIDGVYGFKQVEGEAVKLGGIVDAFTGRSQMGLFRAIYDEQTGMRISTYEDSYELAQNVAESRLASRGLLWWRDAQMASMVRFGRPPEPEIEIIQESQVPGEIETCNRETHCGYH